MIYLYTFFYYVCFASAVLMYGIGTNISITSQISDHKSLMYFVKILMNIFITSVLTWLITYYILQPIHLEEIFPLVAFLTYVCISAFLEALIRLTSGKSTVEFIFSYLVVILSVLESTSIVNTIIIATSCIVSVVVMIPLVYAFKRRLKQETNDSDNYYSRLFIFLAIILLVISVWDALWMNSGVLK